MIYELFKSFVTHTKYHQLIQTCATIKFSQLGYFANFHHIETIALSVFWDFVIDLSRQKDRIILFNSFQPFFFFTAFKYVDIGYMGLHWCPCPVYFLSLTLPGTSLYSHLEFFRTLGGQSLYKSKLLGFIKRFTCQSRQTTYIF